ncbi:MAG: asparagine synthase [Bacteroidales bacterium]|nr:asparagine synthase [Bacteroidales bacterium]
MNYRDSQFSELEKKRFLINSNKEYPTLLDKFISTGYPYTKKDIESLNLPDFIIPVPNQHSEENEINAVFQYVIENYMAGQILVKTDRAAMANSLELRSPLLDVDFAEFCLSMPPHFKIDTHKSKIIFRDVMKDFLPSKVINKSKQGFGAPGNWENTPSVLELKQEYLSNKSKNIWNHLPYDFTTKMIEKKGNFWEFLVLSVWFEKNYTNC